MTTEDRIGFDMGCAIGWGMDSLDVDLLLAEAGLDPDTCTLDEARQAVRDKVGIAEFYVGLQLIRLAAAG